MLYRQWFWERAAMLLEVVETVATAENSEEGAEVIEGYWAQPFPSPALPTNSPSLQLPWLHALWGKNSWFKRKTCISRQLRLYYWKLVEEISSWEGIVISLLSGKWSIPHSLYSHPSTRDHRKTTLTFSYQNSQGLRILNFVILL